MEPTETKPENPVDAMRRAACDLIVERAAEMMVSQVGASVEMMIDRMFTYAAAQMATVGGSDHAAKVLRDVADKIDAGLFHRVTGENVISLGRH